MNKIPSHFPRELEPQNPSSTVNPAALVKNSNLRSDLDLSRHILLAQLILAGFIQYGGALLAQEFSESFDSPSALEAWSAPDGLWQIGIPISGPGSAYSGSRLAATNLSGDYPPNADSRLISPRFRVPNADTNPQLQFYHWFDLALESSVFSPLASGSIQIRSSTGEWEDVGLFFHSSSADWSRTIVNLSPYSDSTIQVAFLFTSSPSHSTSAGWYIDQIELLAGPTAPLSSTQGFESDASGWFADNGLWQIGQPHFDPSPPFGPKSPIKGTKIAGTNLSGDYPKGTSSRLISPVFSVPDSSDFPTLQFWHWFAIHNEHNGIYRNPETNDITYNNRDHGQIQIRSNGGAWQDLGNRIESFSPDWSRYSIDLAEFSNTSVQIAFQLNSYDSWGSPRTYSGWYIDEVELVSSSPHFSSPEDFEGNAPGWHADNGLWQFGTPSNGPDSSKSGTRLAGTRLSANTSSLTTSRLTSPRLVVPDAALDPSLQFWQWFEGGTRKVQIRTQDDDWVTLESASGGESAGWSKTIVDLSAHSGQSVQLGFQISDSRGPGWFIDDVEITASIFCPDSSANAQVITDTTAINFPICTTLPDQNYSFRFLDDAPTGASLALGQFTWFPTPEQRFGEYSIEIGAFQDSNSLQALDRTTLRISFPTVNHAPVVAEIDNQPISVPSSRQVSLGLEVSNPDNHGGPYRGNLFADKFEEESFTGFEAVSVKSNKNWEASRFGERTFAQILGFGADEASDDWLVIPELDLREASEAELSFETAKLFDGPDLEILVSTTHRRGRTLQQREWTPLTVPLSAGNEQVVESGDLSLEEWLGEESVSIAFRYTSTGTNAGQAANWQVGRIRVKGVLPPIEQEIILSLDPSPGSGFCEIDPVTQALVCDFTEAPESEYKIAVRATDDGAPLGRDAALSSTASIQFLLGDLPVVCPFRPAAELVGNASVGTPFTLDLLAPNQGPLSPVITLEPLSIPGLPVVTITDGVLSWTPTQAQANQNYVFTILANHNGQPLCPGIVTVNVTGSAVFATLPTQDVLEDQRLSVDLLAPTARPLPPNLTLSLDSPNQFFGASLTDGILTWTPGEQDGGQTFNISFSARRNNQIVETGSLPITVTEDDKPSVMRSVQVPVLQVGDVFTERLELTDPDIPPTPSAYTDIFLESAPEWMKISNLGIFEAVPTEPGTSIATVRFHNASNGESITGTVSITVVDSPDPAPSLLVDFPASVTINQAVSGKATLRTPNNPDSPHFFSLSGAPEGMTIDPFTGIIEWTPAENQIGDVTNILVEAILSPDRLQNSRPILDDDTPREWQLEGNEPWDWIRQNPVPISGERAHQSSGETGLRWHFYTSSNSGHVADSSGFLVTYVYLDPSNPPKSLLLQWNRGDWNHRAYWGDPIPNFTEVSDPSANRFMGSLPATGKWVRLAVPSEWVGLENQPIEGISFAPLDGRVVWDYTGTSPTRLTFSESFSIQVVGTTPNTDPNPSPNPDPVPSLDLTRHSADYRDPAMVIDGSEVNRVLAYWRTSAYHTEASGVDGYAPGAGPQTGARHSADYRDPVWRIDGSEVNRVLAYWRNGGYRVDANGVDGFAPIGSTVIGGLQRQSLAMLAEPRLGIESLAPTSQDSWLIQATMHLSEAPLALKWQPSLPTGWELIDIKGNAAPVLNQDTIVWTAPELSQILKLTLTVKPIQAASLPLSLGGTVEQFVRTQAEPKITLLAPQYLSTSQEFLPVRLTFHKNAQCTLTFTAPYSGIFQVESSIDLTVWRLETTVRIDHGNQPVEIKYQADGSQRFFRLRPSK